MKVILTVPAAAFCCLASIGGCKPPEPTPSLYADLGTEDAPLLPPPSAWHDASVGKGTAEFRTFRKPAEAAPKSADNAPEGSKDKEPAEDDQGGEPAGPEGEIRNLAADFNAALAKNDLEEATKFLTDAQAEGAPGLFEAVHRLDTQLKALVEAAPALVEKAAGLAPHLTLKDALKLDLQAVRIVDDTNATATLAGGDEVKFVIGEEDYWYVESPVLTVLIAERERIEKLAKDIEEALAKGSPDEAAVAALGTSIDELSAAVSTSDNPAESG